MRSGYRLLSYSQKNGKPRAGVMVGENVHDAADVLGVGGLDTMGILARWDEFHPRLDAFAKAPPAEGGRPIETLALTAPLLYPGAFFCAGANYWDHLEEMADFVKKTTGHAPS